MGCPSPYTPKNIFGHPDPNTLDVQVVPIEEEPSHCLVQSSDFFLVFDVSIFPGKTSLFHKHTKDSIIVCIEGADVTSRKPEDDQLVERPPIPSRCIYYRGYGNTPFVHQVTNRSANVFRTLDIELVKPEPALHLLQELPRNFEVIVDNERARASKFSLGPGEATQEIHCTGAFLLTAFDTGSLSIKSDQQPRPNRVDVIPGWVDIQETSQNISIANTGKQKIELAIVEVK